jgi:nucleotide-binding universal stress UspA family protein
MFRKILVPLDGSTFGEHALPLALNIAWRAGARLQLAHVHQPVAPAYGGGDVAADVILESTVRNYEHGYLDRIVDRVARLYSVPVSPLLLEGPVADTLCAQAAQDADLLVMTTHGRGPLGRLWLGSVADQLVRRCSLPLLLVKPGPGKPDLTREVLPQDLMIPLDGTPMAEQILEPAIALGSVVHANYTLVRVIKPATIGNYGDAIASNDEFDRSLLRQVRELFDREHTDAEAYLDSVAQRLRAQALCVRTRVLSNARVAEGLLKEARTGPTDLIALETHGRGGLARLFQGSVADKLLRGGSTPLLVHHSLGSQLDDDCQEPLSLLAT